MSSFISSSRDCSSKQNLLLLCTGSVATLKLPELVCSFSDHFNIRVACSSSSLHFLQQSREYNPLVYEKFQALGGYELVYTDADEWIAWNSSKKNSSGSFETQNETETEKTDEILEEIYPKNQLIGYNLRKNQGNHPKTSYVLHIELRKWANLAVIAPLSANSLSILANGGSSSLISSVLRAWEFKKSNPHHFLVLKNIKNEKNKNFYENFYNFSSSFSSTFPSSSLSNDFFTEILVSSSSPSSSCDLSIQYLPLKPIFLCPAMNTLMWEHPHTFSHLKTLLQLGYQLILPIKKVLACQEEGAGAMENVQEIFSLVLQSYSLYQDFISQQLSLNIHTKSLSQDQNPTEIQSISALKNQIETLSVALAVAQAQINKSTQISRWSFKLSVSATSLAVLAGFFSFSLYNRFK